MNSSNCSGGCIKWRKKPDKSMYYTLCQNLPTGIKGFPATAGCEILTCAMTRFWTILLLVAIAAPAVEICLNSLFFSVTFSTKHSQHFKLSISTPKNFSLSVPEMQWRQSEVIQFDTEVHKTLLLSLVTLQARFINVFPLLKLCHTSKRWKTHCNENVRSVSHLHYFYFNYKQHFVTTTMPGEIAEYPAM